eukprot:TRINITY_DN30018_c0_g1_i1.p1 TRINITY_DN30018_c0_g1~~TRINITY_DN30018_c0_g1_i1.p1  ORF type:complete len:528 (+),score=107.93 TRINITY_DN30018_c0_g1_i1:293-1876(+)
MDMASLGWPRFRMFDQRRDEAPADADHFREVCSAFEDAEVQEPLPEGVLDEEATQDDLLPGFAAAKADKLALDEAAANRNLEVEIRHAVTGDVLKNVRLRPSDTVARLCDAALGESSQESMVFHRFIFQFEELQHHTTVGDAGIQDGDIVCLVGAPLQCITVSHDGSARIWPLKDPVRPSEDGVVRQSSEELRPTVLRAGGGLKSVVMSPCRSLLLTLSTEQGGVGHLWDAETREPLCRLQGGASSASFAPNGQCLAGVDVDGIGRIWSLQDGEVLHKLVPPDSCAEDSDDEVEMSFANFSPCGKVLVTGAGLCAQLWDTSSGQLLHTLNGHQGAVRDAALSPDGQLLLTASTDATARLWSCRTGSCLEVVRGHQKALSLCAFAPNQASFLTAAQDGSVKVWRLSELRRARMDGTPPEIAVDCMCTIWAEGGVVNSALFSPDGERLLIASAAENAKLHRADTGDLQLKFEGLHEDWIRFATFSPDGRLVATASYDGNAGIWSACTGKCLRKLEGHGQAVTCAEIIAL